MRRAPTTRARGLLGLPDGLGCPLRSPARPARRRARLPGPGHGAARLRRRKPLSKGVARRESRRESGTPDWGAGKDAEVGDERRGKSDKDHNIKDHKRDKPKRTSRKSATGNAANGNDKNDNVEKMKKALQIECLSEEIKTRFNTRLAKLGHYETL